MFKITSKNFRMTSMTMLIVNFEHISDLFPMFLLLTLNKSKLAGLFQCFLVFCSQGFRTSEDNEIKRNIGTKLVYKSRARYHLNIIAMR